MKALFTIAEQTLPGFAQPAGLALHHIGFVVRSIRMEIEGFASSVGAHWSGEIFEDSLQGVRVAFLQPASAADPAIELVEPMAEQSPVSRFLERGGGLHHLCYEVDDLEQELKSVRSRGGLVVKSPLPATAFQRRRIAWVTTPQRLVIEYLERRAETQSTPDTP